MELVSAYLPLRVNTLAQQRLIIADLIRTFDARELTSEEQLEDMPAVPGGVSTKTVEPEVLWE